MNLARATQRAARVPGRKSAARLYNDIEYELALGEPEHHLELIGEQALVLLEDGFPGVRVVARTIEEPPSLSRRAGDALHGIGHPTARALPAAPQSARTYPASRTSRELYTRIRAHPAFAVATVATAIVVIVHFLTYIVLGAIALTAIDGLRART
jgi:hypothetical protein